MKPGEPALTVADVERLPDDVLDALDARLTDRRRAVANARRAARAPVDPPTDADRAEARRVARKMGLFVREPKR